MFLRKCCKGWNCCYTFHDDDDGNENNSEVQREREVPNEITGKTTKKANRVRFAIALVYRLTSSSERHKRKAFKER